MPRQDASGTMNETAPGLTEFSVALVDARDATYYDAIVQIIGSRVNVMNRERQLVGTYELDGPPVVDDEAKTAVGTVNHWPLTVRLTEGCGCEGTRKVIK